MSVELTRLEREVMRMLLEGNDPVLHALRQQFAHSCVVRRELTGVGFFMTFDVSPEVPQAAGGKSFALGDVYADIKGLSHGAGFVLFVSAGVIDCLEGYTYDEPWPPTVEEFELWYEGNKGKRDIDALKKKWS